MFEQLFEKIRTFDEIEAKLETLLEKKTWEEIAKALYQILDDIDTADDMCRENSEAFRSMVMNFQAKKNQYLASYNGQTVVRVDEKLHTYDFHCKTCKYDDELRLEKNPNFCPKCGSKDIDWYLLNESTNECVCHIYGMEDDELLTFYKGMSASYTKDKAFKTLGPDKKEVEVEIKKRGLNIPVQEAVETSTEDPQQKMKDKYKDKLGKLSLSTWTSESTWYKFWLLTDGTIVPVELSHRKTAQDAMSGLEELDLYEIGVFRGDINSKTNELDVSGTTKLTKQQKTALVNISSKYFIEHVYVDVTGDNFNSPVKSPEHLDYLLTYGSKVTSESKKVFKVDEGARKDAVVNKVISNKAAVISALMKAVENLPKRVDKFRKLDKNKPGYIVNVPNPEIGRINKLIKMVRGEDADGIWNFFGALVLEVEKYSDVDLTINENLVPFAQKELQLAGLFDKDSDYKGMLGEAVMELIQAFAKQGHSGCSAAMTIAIFDKLANWKPLTELTDDPGEWNDVSEMSGNVPMWQSGRNPACFSGDGGKTYWNVDEIDNSKEETNWDHKKIYTSEPTVSVKKKECLL